MITIQSVFSDASCSDTKDLTQWLVDMVETLVEKLSYD